MVLIVVVIKVVVVAAAIVTGAVRIVSVTTGEIGNIYELFIDYYVPGVVLSSVHVLTHLILTIVHITWAVPVLQDIMHENIIHQTQQRAKGKIGMQCSKFRDAGWSSEEIEQGLLSDAAFKAQKFSGDSLSMWHRQLLMLGSRTL